MSTQKYMECVEFKKVIRIYTYDRHVVLESLQYIFNVNYYYVKFFLLPVFAANRDFVLLSYCQKRNGDGALRHPPPVP